MSTIQVTGWGAVSSAGWGTAALREVCRTGVPCPTAALDHPGLSTPITARQVPPAASRPSFLAHPRLRRSSAISTYSAAASLEALGKRVDTIRSGECRLGIVFASMTGCVVYSRRFFDEVLKDPTTASPILFPETVFNAPASHLATYLNCNTINYTLIGDPGTFLQGLAIAAGWLTEERVDLCLVVGAEELDWLVAGAQRLFHRDIIIGEGAGALLLERKSAAESTVELDCITRPSLYTRDTSREAALRSVRDALGPGRADKCVLIDSLTGSPRMDAAESAAWSDWPGQRLSLKPLVGEAFGAGSALQCVMAADLVERGEHTSALVNVAGCNQQAIAARFVQD